MKAAAATDIVALADLENTTTLLHPERITQNTRRSCMKHISLYIWMHVYTCTYVHMGRDLYDTQTNLKINHEK